MYSSLERMELSTADVYYLSAQYCFVFVIDMSSTMMEVVSEDLLFWYLQLRVAFA